MAKEKPGVMLYWEMFDVLESLMDGQAKIMLQAIRNYSQHGQVPDFSGDALLATLWMLVKPKIDADSDRYEKIRKQRTDAVNARWGRERAKEHSDNGSIQPYTNEYEDIQNIPTAASAPPTETPTDPIKGTKSNGLMVHGLTLISQPNQSKQDQLEEERKRQIDALLGKGGC